MSKSVLNGVLSDSIRAHLYAHGTHVETTTYPDANVSSGVASDIDRGLLRTLRRAFALYNEGDPESVNFGDGYLPTAICKLLLEDIAKHQMPSTTVAQAICDPNDTFDEEFGKDLVSIRVRDKILHKQAYALTKLGLVVDAMNNIIFKEFLKLAHQGVENDSDEYDLVTAKYGDYEDESEE